jgi:thioredoxin-like negative regulator of GroEL
MTAEGSAAPQEISSATADKPKLVIFYSPNSGRCRRVDGFIAQTLQHRHNHDTFNIIRVSVDARPDLAERFRVTDLPTLLLIDQRKVQRRIGNPKSCRELARELAPWLR